MNIRKLKHLRTAITKRYLNYLVYHNHKFRAKGLYPTVKDFVEKKSGTEKVYFEVYPETISELNVPENLINISSDYIKYELKAAESAKYILKINKGRILSDFTWTHAIFDEDDKIIGDVSLDLFLKEGQTIKDSRILKRKFFPDVHYLKGTVFHTIAGGGSYDNYFHWLIDSLPKIHILKESGLFDQVDWFYVPTIQHDYHIDSLKALGIPEHKIVDGKKYPHIKADVLLASSYCRGPHEHIHKWIIDFYNKEFPPVNKPKFTSKRYFISRKDANTRRIINEDEVSEFLSQYNVETVILSKLNFQEKIDLFAYAELIISYSAAGTTNYIFCKENTKVLELFGDKFIDFRFYYDIAVKRNLDFHYLIGKNVGDSDNIDDGQYNHVVIDIDALKEMLEKEMKITKKEKTGLVNEKVSEY